MADVEAPRRAAVYLRLSHDPEGTSAAIERQRIDCTKLVESRGWNLVTTYIDNDVSAYRKGVRRPEFERMLTDMATGTIDSVVVYRSDRLARRPIDLERFIEACEGSRTLFVSCSESDFSGTSGLLMLRILVAFANQESAVKGERVARAYRHRAEQGTYNGGGSRQLGYNIDGTHHPVEAPFVKKTVERLLNGDSLAAVLEDAKRAGVKPVRGGGAWRSSNLARALRSPRLAGLQVYRGEVIGVGAWEPIVDRADWEKLQLIFDRRARGGGTAMRKHMLSGVARCGRCQTKLTGVWASDHGRVLYRCDPSGYHHGCGRLSIFGDLLEHIVTERLIYVLSGPDADEVLAQTTTDESGALLAQLRDDEAAIERLTHDHYVDRSIPKPAFLAAKGTLDNRIEATKVELAKCSTAMVLPRAEDLLRAEWERRGVAWRRAVVDSVIESVVVKPNTPGKRHDPGRVEVRWRF